MIGRRAWWQAPELRTDEDEHRERRVGWLELFYDLVFVVVVSGLSHNLSADVSWTGVLGFSLLFIPVWWLWNAGTIYNDRFESGDLSHRLLTLLQMLPVAGLAVFAHYGLGKTAVGFALSYAAARVLIICLWLRAGWHEPRFRPVSNRYAAGFTVSVAMFILSCFVESPLRYLLWGIGLAFDLLSPLTTIERQKRFPRLSTSHIPERFGLFVLIVLGESIIGVVQGAAQNPSFSFSLGLTGTLGIVLAFGVWWLYFDFIGRRKPNLNPWIRVIWSYLHLPLVMSLVAVGAGVLNVVASESGTLSAPVRWLIAGAVAVSVATMGALELTLQRTADEPTDSRLSPGLKFLSGLLALLVGLFGVGLGASALLVCLLGCLLIVMVYGALVWFRQPLGEAADLEQVELEA